MARLLREFPADGSRGGRCYADVSACATPFRRSYFQAIRDLPAEALLYGSDLPTPVFELSADVEERMEDLGAVLRGEVERIVVPEGNLIDVSWREMERAFPGHAMFQNFQALLEA